MPEFSISDVARKVGLRPSAIRYYEHIRLLPPAVRSSAQRRYDPSTLHRLAIIQRARQLGFTLGEIQQLFFGFGNTARASERWRKLSERKLVELDNLMDAIKAVRSLLRKMATHCRCETLDQCGKAIFQSEGGQVAMKALLTKRRHAL